jgi:hypothetical protein
MNPVLAQTNAWSAGFGVKRNDYGLDFSVVPFGELGLTYRGTVNYTFGRPGAAIASIVPYLSTTEGGSPVVITSKVGGRDKVAAWGLYVYNSAKSPQIVHRVTGKGPPPKEFIWDGSVDHANDPGNDIPGAMMNSPKAPEGTYYAILTARYTTGNTHNSKYLQLDVNNSPPKIEVRVHKNSRNPRSPHEVYVPANFIPVSVDGKAVAHWKLEVMDAAGRVFRTFTGAGQPPEQVNWDGKGDDGSAFISGQVYQVRYWLKDPLGNAALNPAPVAFRAVFR